MGESPGSQLHHLVESLPLKGGVCCRVKAIVLESLQGRNVLGFSQTSLCFIVKMPSKEIIPHPLGHLVSF